MSADATPSSTATRPERRTQAQRRAATREALLQAALACVLEDGYSGLTAVRVAERAGVSPPTQRFYFRTRADFVAAAIERLVTELTEQVRDHTISRARSERHRFEALLDTFWAISHGAPFQTLMELYGVARHDPDVKVSVIAANGTVTRIIAAAAAEMFPERFSRPAFRALFETALATTRGLAMFAPLEPVDLDARWRTTRGQLLALYDTLEP